MIMEKDMKYKLLTAILDDIAQSAPENLTIYHPKQDNVDNQIHKRSRAFIHLFMRVRFGLLDFNMAEKQITDGREDGGLDAYHIDGEERKIYLIQSKFVTSAEKFEEQKVNAYGFFKMELDRIIQGEEKGENGNDYNGKVRRFQRQVKNIPDISRYKYSLIYLGNIKSELTPEKLRKVTGGVCDDVEIIDGSTFYKEVQMPYLQHDFFNKRDFVLKIKVNQNQSNRITYQVMLDNNNRASVHLSFVPTKEIAVMMFKYRNSLLRYNPRCYVGIKQGGVNKAIKESVTNTSFNKFSLLNNGITMICSDFKYTERNAEPGTATLLITNPQIVNGGQTAFTLAHLLESETNDEIFKDKEVLVKFITTSEDSNRLDFINKVSEATNNQTPVNLSDRRSNDKELIDLQNYLFDKYGLLFERKKGEFYDSIQNNLVSSDNVLSRDILMRLLLVYRGEVARARSAGIESLFRNYSLDDVDYNLLFRIIVVYRKVDALEQRVRDQKKRYKVKNWGSGLKYGKLAISYVVFKLLSGDDNEIIDKKIKFIESKWLDFENTVANHEHNADYYSDGFDYANYYKGRTINKDLKRYINQISESK